MAAGAHDDRARKELRQAEERYRNELMDDEERLLLGDHVRRLRQRYEERPCGECSGHGTITHGVVYDPVSAELVREVGDCPTCEGSGTVDVFLYPPARMSR